MDLNKYLLYILLATLLCGCPIKRSHPLTDARHESIDLKLIGDWKLKSEGPTTFKIMRFNETELLILGSDSNKNKSAYMRAFTTIVWDKKYLNLVELNQSKDEFMYFEYSIKDDKLFLKTVESKLFKNEKLHDQGEFFNEFLKHIYNKNLVSKKPIILERINERPDKGPPKGPSR